MSYEPTLVVSKEDLNSKRVLDILHKERYSKNKEKQSVAEYLLKVNNQGTVKVKDTELVICQPELTSFNMLIRKKLVHLNIDFGVDN